MVDQVQIPANLLESSVSSIPLIEVRDAWKTYVSGESTVNAIGGVGFRIDAGEFVAIVGASGSGKSTMMHILGCLDRPTRGSYLVWGRDVSSLSPDELAALRREMFGFVFQRYNLLTDATAAENVEIPAIYAGQPKKLRWQRACDLLNALGLGERINHWPAQLSGGEQQRVSIARALMNDPPVILADEPTGALDMRNGEEVMRLLKQLHMQGRTIVLITHDPALARKADRLIQLRDGRVVADESQGNSGPAARWEKRSASGQRSGSSLSDDLWQAVIQAFRSMRANRFRTALTLLGVVIGVAAVVAVLAIGSGSTKNIMNQIAAMGTNVLNVRPGAPGTRVSGDVATLTAQDAEAIAAMPNVATVAPTRAAPMTIRAGKIDHRTQVQGTWPGFVAAGNWAMSDGVFFDQDDLRSFSPVVVLGATVAKNLFPERTSPVGKYVLLRNVPFEVIGVLAPKGASPMGSDMDDTAVVPLTTGFMRLYGQRYLSSITVSVEDVEQIQVTETGLRELLLSLHGTEDFQVRNATAILDTAQSMRSTMALYLGAVGFISLVIGGIGVMNIMLVSVTERTREIGVRMATGARRRNIMLQFNTEAVVICGIGGVIGILSGLAIIGTLWFAGISVVVAPIPGVIAFGCAFLTGLLSGFLPARTASRLDPVAALASE
jgi:macrolide transport system ATP-binding/permease protein